MQMMHQAERTDASHTAMWPERLAVQLAEPVLVQPLPSHSPDDVEALQSLLRAMITLYLRTQLDTAAGCLQKLLMQPQPANLLG